MTVSLRDMAALYAAGLLSGEERALFLARLGAASANERQECAAMQDAAAVLAEAGAVAPPDDVRARIARGLRSSAARPGSDGFTVCRADEGWTAHAVAGVYFKQLAVDRETGAVTVMARLAPGTVFPGHHHAGTEQCLVLAGDLISDGLRLGPGDFQVAEPGSDHAELYTESGCTALLILSAHDYAQLT